MRGDRRRPWSLLCCDRCAHSMARARRQPDAPSAIFSNARIDSHGRGGRMPFVARSLTRDHGMDARVAVRSSSGIQTRSSLERPPALVAQLDRAPDFESGGRGFESLRARHKINNLWPIMIFAAPGL